MAACAWVLDIILLTPRCWVRAGTCYSAAALLLPCSFNGVEGVQGPPAPPLLLSPLLLAPLLLPPLLLSPLPSSATPSSRSPSSRSPFSPTPCHNTAISNCRRFFLPTTKTTRFRQSHARSTARLCRRVEAHRSTVVNLGGVWDLSAENKRPARQNGDEEKDVPDKRYALSSVAARNTYNHGSLSPRTSPRDAGICSSPGM